MPNLLSYWEELVLTSKRVLLLQGPIGPFFAELQSELQTKYHCDVYKINFNGGDEYFYPKNDGVFLFDRSPDEFACFLDGIVREYQIDAVICFGGQRIYHQHAKAYCLKSDAKITFWAFEEGYLRPHYVTLEKWGVNDHSILQRDAISYKEAYGQLGEPIPPETVAPGFKPVAKLAMQYYTAVDLKKRQYALYQHHRQQGIGVYAGAWIVSGYRKIAYKWREKRIAKQITDGQWGRFFIVPLQVHNDSQVIVHCQYKSVASFLRSVLYSFAKNAPKETNLIIKHHPMDRGFVHYGFLIKQFAKHYGITNRVLYVFDVPLPVLMRKAAGMVVINSTSGLSAMIHHLPVKVLGKAHYDFAGLTDQQPLYSFWKNPNEPDAVLFNAYRLYHLKKTQLNGSFYGRMVWPHVDIGKLLR